MDGAGPWADAKAMKFPGFLSSHRAFVRVQPQKNRSEVEPIVKGLI